MRILVDGGTLLIVFRFGSNARNDCEYIGQPSRLVHLRDTEFELCEGEKNDFDCSINAGLSSVLIFTSFIKSLIVRSNKGTVCVRRLMFRQFHLLIKDFLLKEISPIPRFYCGAEAKG